METYQDEGHQGEGKRNKKSEKNISSVRYAPPKNPLKIKSISTEFLRRYISPQSYNLIPQAVKYHRSLPCDGIIVAVVPKPGDWLYNQFNEWDRWIIDQWWKGWELLKREINGMLLLKKVKKSDEISIMLKQANWVMKNLSSDKQPMETRIRDYDFSMPMFYLYRELDENPIKLSEMSQRTIQS